MINDTPEQSLRITEAVFTFGRATTIANRWSKGLDNQGNPWNNPKEYNTTLRSKNGNWYITNEFDPRILALSYKL